MRSAFAKTTGLVRRARGRIRKLSGVELVTRIFQRTFGGNISQASAGIAYFAILSLFPLLILAVSIATLFFDRSFLNEQLALFLTKYAPVSSALIEDNVNSVLKLRGPVGVLSFVMLVMSGSSLFASLGRVANNVLGIQARRRFYTEKALHLGMMAVSGVLVLASVLATVLLQIATSVGIDSLGGLELWRGAAVQVGTFMVAFLFTALTFLFMYRFLPNAAVPWRHVLVGATVAAVLFELSKLLFILYMRTLSSPELVYGSLGSAVALLLWCYIAAHTFVIGAAVIAEVTNRPRKPGHGHMPQAE